MSVLKMHRTESKAEFVNTANEIFKETLQFLSRLSSRYSRLLASDVIRLASEVLDNAEKANNIYPSDEKRLELRKAHLLEARAALMALDVHMAHCYEVMMLNPHGCFSTASGKEVPPGEAVKRLDHMAQSLGEKIDKENNLLTNVLKSDRARS